MQVPFAAIAGNRRNELLNHSENAPNRGIDVAAERRHRSITCQRREDDDIDNRSLRDIRGNGFEW